MTTVTTPSVNMSSFVSSDLEFTFYKPSFLLYKIIIPFFIYVLNPEMHKEHSKFPENLLRGSEAPEGGGGGGGGCGRGVTPPSTVWSFFVFQCGIVCSGAYFRGYFHIFLHIISVFN